MKTLVNETLRMLQSGDTQNAIETFCAKSARYKGKNDKLLSAIRSLYKRYGEADEGTKKHLALLSALLYDLIPLGEGRQHALLCMSLAGLAEDVPLSLGISEALFFALGAGTRKIVLPTDVDDTPNQNILSYFKKGSHVVKLSARHNIHCYHNDSGALVLLSVIPVNNAVLADEESFAGEEPLYFTESSHFISPVYLMEKATILLDELLRLVNYPQLRIRHRVVYAGSDCYPINEEEMWDDGPWTGRDLENIVIHKTPDKIPIVGLKKKEIPACLLEMLQVASLHFDNLPLMTEPKEMARKMHEYIKKHVKLA